MSGPPRVTVVIPTYNRADLLMEAIGSVLAQSFSSIEVVVCDDGSTDDTAARVAALGRPARYCGLPRTGSLAATRNRGIEVAQGALVAFLDDDDLWEPEKLAGQIALLERHPELGLVYTDRQVVPADGSGAVVVHTPTSSGPTPLLDLVLSRQMPCIGSVLVRRELLQEIGGFDETLTTAEDLDLYLRLAPLTRAAGVPEPLVIVRRRAGSLSEERPAVFENAIEALERWRAAGSLPSFQRGPYRRMLAHLHARLARNLGARGDVIGAARAAFRAVAHAPASLAAWACFPRACRAALRR
jgi:glycosyltransferase involved in cell wall biosynthesis